MKHIWDIDICPKKEIAQMSVFELREYAKQLEEKLTDKDKLIMAIIDGNRRPHGEWIPCFERLPEEDDEKNVLVSVNKRYAIYDIILLPSKSVKTEYKLGHIDAWMPLPEPYEERR